VILCLLLLLPIISPSNSPAPADTHRISDDQRAGSSQRVLKPKILWVPIEERNRNISSSISSAFYKAQHRNKAIEEKVERIGKMLNDSLDVKKEKLDEGLKRLHDLTQNVYFSNTAVISTIGTSSIFIATPMIITFACLMATR